MKNLKAIIFDAYGTVFDTGRGSIQATEAILKLRGTGIDASEFYSKWKSVHRAHIHSLHSFVREEEIFRMDLIRLYEDYGIDGSPDEDVKIMLSTFGHRVVFPETKVVLMALRKLHKVVIGSTTDEAPLIADIRRNQVIVDDYFTSETLKVYKPSRKFFLSILGALQLSASEAIYVGDSQEDDICGAKAAGLPVVWVNRKRQLLRIGVPQPDYEIHALSGLLDLLH